ncbi:Membrane protein involved in the export of O-antigen and teichoic acid [Novosphingobium sp. CF614]|uniref:oligosaccharide flippase family protein n=1 Tax=Novosphingobium sp. CF614 TaxID=1884364 RepID=UPI0008F0B3A3|nr:oligosaccharide flippase family protein [Novosphingobium sp. CF614]SFG35203.1 Membrane protein involved in the export of O-antigen and teichoic acid [Novosphingobium sp. CF614]
MAEARHSPPPSPPPTPDNGRGAGSVKSAALWAAASQYSQFTMQFVTSVVISRFFLKPEEIGLFSVALAAAMILSIIQDFGLTRYLGRHPTADEETVRHCTVIAVAFSFILAALVLAIAWPIALFYGEPRLFPILALIAASYLLNPWSIVPAALLARRLDFRATFLVNSTGALANSGCALALAALGYSAESLAWAMIAQAAVRAVAAQILRPTPFSLSFRMERAREIIGFGSGSALLYLSGGIGMRTPDLIVGRMQGMSAAGLFSRGVALAAQLHYLVAGAVGAIYYPTFARLHDEEKDLGPYYERVVAAHGVIVWPAMALLAVLSQPVILMLYGPGWAEAAPLLAFVALAECFFVALPLHMDLPILLGRLRQLLYFNIADTALSVATLAAGAAIGVEAAAASRLVYGLGWFCLYALWLRRLIGFSWRAVLRIYAASLGVTLATVLPAIYAVTVWRSPATLGFLDFVGTTGASALAWLCAVHLLRHPAREDLVGVALHVLAPLRARLKPRPA